MRKPRIGERICDSYLSAREKIKASAGLSLVGYVEIDDSSKKLILSSEFAITEESVRDYVFSALQHAAFPVHGSIQLMKGTDGRNYATVIVSKPEKVMVPESEKKNLVALNASVFLDQELGEVWEKQDVEGRSMFVRKNEDNIEELLSKLYLTASYGARTMVKAELFVPQVLVGMAVRFYAYENGKPSILTGNIVDISAEGIDIEIPSETETKKYRVKPDAILQAESINNINQCVDYLRKCYNPKDGSFDYAGMFLKKR